MTREEKIEVFTMKLDGMSYEEIANKKGVSKQYIHQTLVDVLKKKNRKSAKVYEYPVLNNWLIENGMSVKTLAENIGVHKVTLYNKLSCKSKFSVEELEKISDITGLSSDEILSKGD